MKQRGTNRALGRVPHVAATALLLGGACGGQQQGVQAEQSAASSDDTAEVAVRSTGSGSQVVQGGMDSGGLLPPVGPQNTSSDGAVLNNFGEFLVDVRSTNSLIHYYQEKIPGVAPDQLTILHQVITKEGRQLNFGFPYLGGRDSFDIAGRGYLSIERDGVLLLAKTGHVQIEPLENGNITVLFEQLGLGHSDRSEVTFFLGDGLVLGPLRHVCQRAEEFQLAVLSQPPQGVTDAGVQMDTVGIGDASAGQPSLADAAVEPELDFDEDWIHEFCGR